MAVSAEAMSKVLQEIMKGAGGGALGGEPRGPLGGLPTPSSRTAQAPPELPGLPAKSPGKVRQAYDAVKSGKAQGRPVDTEEQPDLVASSFTPQIPQPGGPGGITPELLMNGPGAAGAPGLQMNPQLMEFLRGLQGGMNRPRF